VALAAGLVIAAGEAPAEVFAVLGKLTGVRGRMQLAATRRNGAAVFVDYAHTPDAIATALRALRPHVMGRIVIVFGAGGDRDRTKRPLMGAAGAGSLAQVVNAALANKTRFDTMKAFFGETGIGDNAGIWQGVPVHRPEFKAQVRRQQEKRAAKRAQEAIGT
jgi:hypothetical protein